MANKRLLEKAGVLSKSAVRQWRYQRLTAIALVPLTVWLSILLNKTLHAPYSETLTWLTTPINALAIVAWLIFVIYHAVLGLHVVLEDYVSDVQLRNRAIIATNLFFSVLGIAALLSITIILIG